MANIFDGLRKMDNTILKIQIAMLEEVTISSMKVEITQKAKRNTIKAANYVAKIMKKQFDEPEIVRLQDKIEEYVKSLNGLDNEGLITRLKEVLIYRLENIGEGVHKFSSEEEISVSVINCAIRRYKKEFAQDLTPAQKADVVRHKFNEELFCKLKKNIEKQEYEQAKELEELIQKYVQGLDTEQIEDFKYTINKDKINGFDIRKMFVTDEGENLILKVLDNVEPNEHKAFKSMVSGVFFHILGINIPFNVKYMNNFGKCYMEDYKSWISYIGVEKLMSKSGETRLIQELLLIILWTAEEFYGRCFTPYLEELSCWVDDEKRERVVKESEDILKIIKNIDGYEKQYVELKADYLQDVEILEKHNKEIEELKTKRHTANDKTIEEHSVLQELENKEKETKENYIQETNKLDRLVRVKKATDEDRKDMDNTKMAYENARKAVLEQKEKIDNINKEAEEALREINKKLIDTKDLKKSVAMQKEYIEQFEKQISKIKIELDEKAGKMEDWISYIWQYQYDRFEFNIDVIKNIVRSYEYDEICDIEAVLKELYDAKDPYALRNGRGSINNIEEKGEFLAFLTIYGKKVKIYYKAIERDEDELKKVFITDITNSVPKTSLMVVKK